MILLSLQVFGYLIPLKPKGPMISLDQAEFNVGRSMHNNHVIKPNMMPKNFESISKFHFKIFKDVPSGAVYLEDRSSNGTFVNGKKIGKSKKDLLSHNDIIGMTGAKLKHFIYMSTNKDYLKMYPTELRNKYTVSRELGKGACGTVMLGIRKEDYAQVAIKIITKSKVTMVPGASNGVMNEVKLLQAIDHPCVIRLEDVIETEKELYIILELADGGRQLEIAPWRGK